MDNKERSTLNTMYKLLIALTLLGPVIALFDIMPFNVPVVLTIAVITNLVIWIKYYDNKSITTFQRVIKRMLKFFIISMTILLVTALPEIVTSMIAVTDETVFIHMISGVIEFVGSVAAWFYYLVVITMDYDKFKKMRIVQA